MTNEITTLIEEQGKAFEDFKNRHSNELHDVKAALHAIEAKGNRPGAGGALFETAADSEHKGAFIEYVRGGVESQIKAYEAKALSTTGSGGSDGGYAIPKVIDNQIAALLRASGSLRAIANVQTVPSGYKKLISTHGAAATWVGETAARPESTTPKLQELTPSWGELYANPMATQWMIDDSQFDMGNWLANELAEEFMLAENTAFINGTGTNQPKGILAYAFAATADSARAFGTLEMVKTGVNAGWVAGDPAKTLIDTVYKLAAPYRANASWAMNSNLINFVRQLKNSTGDYLWRDGLSNGQPATLLGYPVYELPDMPDVGATTIPILFGDFNRGYMITDREFGNRILRDPFTNKPYVGFYTTKRVGGMLVDSNAIKGIATRV